MFHRSLMLSLFVFASILSAEETNPALKIGDAAPDFKELMGTDGKKYALADFAKKPVLVIAVTCNSCPYANDYEDRLNALAKEFGGEMGKVAVIAINANKVPEDSPAKMKERAEKKGYVYPYVFDESQAVAKAYGATYTPEYYVFNADRKLVYTGAYDDSSDPKKATKHYVLEAVKAALAGEKPTVTHTLAIGCAVRYEKPRRTKRD